MEGMQKMMMLIVVVVLLAVGTLAFSVSHSDDEADAQSSTSKDKKNNKYSRHISNTMTELEKGSFSSAVEAVHTEYEDIDAKTKSLEKTMADLKAQLLDKQSIEKLEKKLTEKSDNMGSMMTQKMQEMKEMFNQELERVKQRSSSSLPNTLGYVDYIKDDKNTDQNTNVPATNNTSMALVDKPYVFRAISSVQEFSAETVTKTGSHEEKGFQSPTGLPPTFTSTATPVTMPNQANKSNSTTPQTTETTSVPVFTISADATLYDNKVMTALVGVIPKNGQVDTPFRFKLILGAKNLASNGYFIPELSHATLSGFAYGNKTLSCVRGVIDRFTYVFEDKTIASVSASEQSSGGSGGGKFAGGGLGEGLGHLSDRYGNECISGQYVSNLAEYMKDRMIASSIATGAGAFATSEEVQETTDTKVTKFVSGNTGKYIAGNVLAGGFKELADIAREQQRDALEFVYIPNGQEVVLNIDKQINIDYNPNGRKLFHGLPNAKKQRIRNARLD